MTKQTTRSYRWLFWGLALLGLTADQASKYHVFAALYPETPGQHGQIFNLIPGWFCFDAQFTEERVTGDDLWSRMRNWSGERQPRVNHGALWGVGGKDASGEGDFNSFFAFISIIAALAIIGWNLRPNAGRDWYLSTALGLILAGTLGNLYDRLVFSGVRDFLHFYWFEFPVFNVADCCLVCGAGLLLLQAFYLNHDAEEKPAAAAATATPETPAAVSATPEPQPEPQVAEAAK